MFFRQLSVYRLESELLDPAALETTLAGHPFAPTRPQQIESAGWLPAIGSLFVHETDQALRLVQQREERSVPARAISETVEARLRERAGTLGEPTRAERAAMKDAVLLELLPQAFPRQSQAQTLIDPVHQQVWFDTITANKIERLSSSLREQLGQWRMSPWFAAADTSGHLARWLLGAPPAGFAIGEGARLVDPRDGGTITVAKLALPDPHVIAHLHEGMKVDQLELIWNEQLRFTLRADGSLTKIKPTEHYAEEHDEPADEDNARLDADQRLMVAAFRRLIADLTRVLSPTPAA
ncbi:recombination-associated protein RdgC [Halothiobacillus sp. DCM-1]|uniref:recombination-associated protein RdgC n=1 Tax=Halothiobacillus sp. DCM-1 TaxID=3112558 RepID=UPI0032434631